MAGQARANNLPAVNCDLFSRYPRRFESRHVPTLKTICIQPDETVEAALTQAWDWKASEPVVTVVAKYRPDSQKITSTEWRLCGKIWETTGPVDSWGGFVATEDLRLTGLKLKWSVEGAAVSWPTDTQAGRNVSAWLTLAAEAVDCTFYLNNAEASDQEVLDETGLDVTEWKAKAKLRFVVQNSKEASVMYLFCQNLFELQGVEKEVRLLISLASTITLFVLRMWRLGPMRRTNQSSSPRWW